MKEEWCLFYSQTIDPFQHKNPTIKAILLLRKVRTNLKHNNWQFNAYTFWVHLQKLLNYYKKGKLFVIICAKHGIKVNNTGLLLRELYLYENPMVVMNVHRNENTVKLMQLFVYSSYNPKWFSSILRFSGSF